MNLIILSIHREVNAMEYKYENYGISDLLGHKTSILGEGINTAMPAIPTEKFMNNLVQKISLTKNVKILTKQDLADLDAKRFVEPDKLLIEGLFGNNRPYQLYKIIKSAKLQSKCLLVLNIMKVWIILTERSKN